MAEALAALAVSFFLEQTASPRSSRFMAGAAGRGQGMAKGVTGADLIGPHPKARKQIIPKDNHLAILRII